MLDHKDLIQGFYLLRSKSFEKQIEMNVDNLKILLGSVDVNKAYNVDRRTLLHVAAWLGDARCIDYLVSKGANIKALDKSGKTPLYWARSSNNIETVQALIKARAAVEWKDLEKSFDQDNDEAEKLVKKVMKRKGA